LNDITVALFDCCLLGASTALGLVFSLLSPGLLAVDVGSPTSLVSIARTERLPIAKGRRTPLRNGRCR
jgi:hypothetical protein